MKFIHTSDVHLGAPFVGVRGDDSSELKAKLLSATLDSFSALVDYAIAEEVDFVLISGDLIDQENKSVLIQIFLDEQFSRLNKSDIDVYLSLEYLDNLDNFKKNNPWSNKVNILSPISNNQADIKLTTTQDKKRVAIVGFSHANQPYRNSPIDVFLERDKKIDYQIGVFYGNPEASDPSKAFDLKKMINLGYDYWALGSLHNQSILNESPFIGYPGTIQGLNKNQPGQKGFILVSESDEQLVPKFIPTAPIEWQNMIADVADVSDQKQLIDAILKALDEQRVTAFQLLSIELNSAENLPEELANRINDGSILQQLNNELLRRFDQFYVGNIYLNYTKQTVQLNNMDNSYWEYSIDKIFSKDNINQKLFGLNDRFVIDYFNNLQIIDNIQSRAQTELLYNQGKKTVDN